MTKISPLEREFGNEEARHILGDFAGSAPVESGHVGSVEDKRDLRMRNLCLIAGTLGVIAGIANSYSLPYSDMTQSYSTIKMEEQK